mgnify:CR=1 FL=1
MRQEHRHFAPVVQYGTQPALTALRKGQRELGRALNQRKLALDLQEAGVTVLSVNPVGSEAGLTTLSADWVRTALRIDQCRNQSVIAQWPVEAPMLMTPDHATARPITASAPIASATRFHVMRSVIGHAHSRAARPRSAIA